MVWKMEKREQDGDPPETNRFIINAILRDGGIHFTAEGWKKCEQLRNTSGNSCSPQSRKTKTRNFNILTARDIKCYRAGSVFDLQIHQD